MPFVIVDNCVHCSRTMRAQAITLHFTRVKKMEKISFIFHRYLAQYATSLQQRRQTRPPERKHHKLIDNNKFCVVVRTVPVSHNLHIMNFSH